MTNFFTASDFQVIQLYHLLNMDNILYKNQCGFLNELLYNCIISYPLFSDVDTGIVHTQYRNTARPKSRRGIMVLSVDSTLSHQILYSGALFSKR